MLQLRVKFKLFRDRASLLAITREVHFRPSSDSDVDFACALCEQISQCNQADSPSVLVWNVAARAGGTGMTRKWTTLRGGRDYRAWPSTATTAGSGAIWSPAQPATAAAQAFVQSDGRGGPEAARPVSESVHVRADAASRTYLRIRRAASLGLSTWIPR